MGKIRVIIQHEYLTRIRSKWFIISTILGPLGFVAMVAIPAIITAMLGDSTEGKVVVFDRTGSVAATVVAADTSRFEMAGSRTEQEVEADVLAETYVAYVVIPENVLSGSPLQLFSRGGTGFTFSQDIASAFEPVVTRKRLTLMGADTSVIDIVERGLSVTAMKVTEQGSTEKDASEASAAIGYGAGFVIYFLIFIYGSMVLRGVVEEKANRIVEVMASSVTPFELLMGKVVGIGLVGLSQVLAWLVLGSGVFLAAGPLLEGAMASGSDMQVGTPVGAQVSPQASDLPFAIPDISIGALLLFVFFFLAGYFIYATLFAAVGSAVDQEADAQQLTMPITLPVILTIMFIGSVVAAPNSALSVGLSLFPLFAPIIMVVRIAATDVPWWQIGLSMILVSATFVGTIWLASRVYRIGILSYGKKPTLKEIASWMVRG
ncbi:MAG: ABC transporter permease [Candidatus Kapaibacteriota bacterium]